MSHIPAAYHLHSLIHAFVYGACITCFPFYLAILFPVHVLVVDVAFANHSLLREYKAPRSAATFPRNPGLLCYTLGITKLSYVWL
jgi:hypothetical protein